MIELHQFTKIESCLKLPVQHLNPRTLLPLFPISALQVRDSPECVLAAMDEMAFVADLRRRQMERWRRAQTTDE